MRAHSTTAEVQEAMRLLESRTRQFLTVPDARAIASWYQDPTDHMMAINGLAQGVTVSTQDLMYQVGHLVRDFLNGKSGDDSDHVELLYLQQFAAMRAGMGGAIFNHE